MKIFLRYAVTVDTSVICMASLRAAASPNPLTLSRGFVYPFVSTKKISPHKGD